MMSYTINIYLFQNVRFVFVERKKYAVIRKIGKSDTVRKL